MTKEIVKSNGCKSMMITQWLGENEVNKILNVIRF